MPPSERPSASSPRDRRIIESVSGWEQTEAPPRRAWALPARVIVATLVLALSVIGTKAYRTCTATSARRTTKRTRAGAAEASAAGADRRVALRTPSGVPIEAWALPSRNGATIVYAHGSQARGMDLAPEALALGATGYGALLVDMPGYGGSSGKPTWGVEAAAALSAAVQHVAVGERVGVFGFSLGSCAAAHVAATTPRVAAVVLAGAFTNVRDQLAYEYRSWGPVTELAAASADRAEGLEFDALRTSDVIGAIAPRPLLLVEGQDDPVVLRR